MLLPYASLGLLLPYACLASLVEDCWIQNCGRDALSRGRTQRGAGKLTHVSLAQEIAHGLQSDVNNVFFAAQAVCIRAEAKLADTNNLGATADARLALQLAENALATAGRAPPLAERPHLVLAQSSRALGLFQEALGNLTLAQARAPPHRAAELDALVQAVRRDMDWNQGEDLRRAGFAGFRSRFGGSSKGGDERHPRHAHPAFAGAGRGGRWEYSDWTKAQWDEEYRAAYHRFSKDNERFGFARANHAFPWEHAQSGTQQSPPDPFAPPFGNAAGASRPPGSISNLFYNLFKAILRYIN